MRLACTERRFSIERKLQGMHASARQAAILRSLEDQSVCRVAELAARLEVSGETIRRDVKALENRGLVAHLHGAVALRNLLREPAFQKRLDQNAEAKKIIARRAAGLINNGDSLMLDTGSTTSFVARALSDHQDLMVVTNCSEIARILSASGRNRVYLAGGEFRADDAAVFGASATAFVQQFRVRWAVLSIGAINLVDGFMDYHLIEAEFSRAVIGQANHIMVVADHSKFGNQASVKVCSLDAVDRVVTDAPPPPLFATAMREAGIAISAEGDSAA